MVQSRVANAAALVLALCGAVHGQLNQNCTVSVLNRTVPVNPDGSWVLPNIPANFGQVKARATCVQNGVTTFGESAFFSVPANGAVNLPAITLGATTPIPTSLGITSPVSSFTAAGQTAQLTVTATYPDGSSKNVTAASSGTNYTISNSTIATITPNGLVTSVGSGTVVIQATNDGAAGITTLQVVVGGAIIGGLPLSWILQHGFDPNDPTLPFEDPDHDGLTNLEEFQKGTDPNNPDTDGDGLTDGDEVHKYGTNPLVADTDHDGIPDGVEIQTGTDPLNPNSYDLKRATATSVLTPSSFSLATSPLNTNVSVQLDWKVNLIDGKTTLDLTNDPRTSYSSNNLTICNFGTQRGLVFAGGAGNCVITISQNTLSVTVPGTISAFTPTPLSFIAIPGFANNVKVRGNYAYVAAGSAGLQVVDVSTKTNPKIVSSLALPSNANDLRIVGTTIYMTTASGLLIIDSTNPLTPRLLGSLSTPDVAWDVAIAGNLAYVAAGGSGLQIANVSNPASPVIVGALSISGGTAKGVAVTGNTAVIAASAAGVVIADITNPAAPRRMGNVATPGDARKVAVNGTAAFIADYPSSMQVVDFSIPAAPVIVAATQDALGGKLQDVLVNTFQGLTFTLGADVFFVNGVPIVDVTQPNNPLPRFILDFSGYRDDNGHGIDVDASYVYMTGEEGTVTDLGTTGDTRLYIGQYRQIVDPFGIPPTISVTSPVSGTPLIQGQTITFSANATDDVAVASVNLLVNGVTVFTSLTPPYQTTYTVPLGITSLTFGGNAVDYGNNVGTATNVTVQVIPDPLTTAIGTVLTSTGARVAGATATALGISGTTAIDGTFSISGLPTIRGPIVVNAIGVVAGVTLAGSSAPTVPVVGGITNVGDIQVGPKPLITSVRPKSALAGTTGVSVTVTGANFTGSTFAFSPASTISIATTVIASDGNSASLLVDFPGTAIGTFALIASGPAGSSDATVTQANRLTSVDPNSTADTDGDGFQDAIEAVYGTDPLDPTSFPVIQAATETEGVAFSVLNAPVTGAGIIEAEGVAFSVLNAPVTGAGIIEAEGVAFSVLNAPVTGAGIIEAEGLAFSVLNAPVTGAGIIEAEGLAFSVLNAPTSATGILEAEGYVSVLNTFGSSKSTAAQTQTDQAQVKTPSSTPPVGVPSVIDPFLDSDGDGLPDWYELLIGTDPYNPDTDGDGLSDFEEVFVYHTNPLLADSDGDGFSDGEEVIFGSDPLNPDSTPLSIRRRAGLVRPAANDLAIIADNRSSSKNSNVKGDAHVNASTETGAPKLRLLAVFSTGLFLIGTTISLPVGAQISVFSSGSDGSDGALNITAPGITYLDPVAMKINPKGDNIFNFTTINIAAGSILKISEVKVHGPVYFLASGDVTIAGVIDISGDASPGTTVTAAEQIPAFAGSGGYSGGLGGVHGDSSHQALAGNGPGGGAAGDINQPYAVGGAFTTNRFLVPLVGGSGGGGTNDDGQYGAQGGAGGGGLLIASSTKITLASNDQNAPNGYPNGSINARGGYGTTRGCGGSGGAVRLVTNSISTTNDFASIYVEGNGGQGTNGVCESYPQNGLIRLESNSPPVGHLALNGTNVSSVPFALNLSTAPPPLIKVDSINGVTINANPFSFPDTTINTGSPVPVVVKATNLPTGATVTIYLLSDTQANQAIPVILTGNTQASSGTANVTFAPGGSRGFVKASWATLGTQSVGK